MTEDERALRYVVTGRVQGVSFRWFTREVARRLGISGWVRNLPGGAVEALGQGPREVMDAFEAWLHDGPPAARVDRVDVEVREIDRTLGPFEIRF